jgi:hypothetical protein
MTCARITLLILLLSFLAACGSGRPAKKIGGIWNASLQNPDGSPAYTFTATLTQSTGSNVDVSAFVFTATAPCLTAPIVQTATFNSTAHSGGYETGVFGMNVSTAAGTGTENVLTLSGTRDSNGQIAGTWTLAGISGCSGGGAYTMSAVTPL